MVILVLRPNEKVRKDEIEKSLFLPIIVYTVRGRSLSVHLSDESSKVVGAEQQKSKTHGCN